MTLGAVGARPASPDGGENGAPVRRARRGRDRRPARRPRRGRACGRWRSSRSRRGAEQVAATRPPIARRGRPVAGGAGGGLPRRLPARGAARARAAPARGPAARAGRDQRPRARASTSAASTRCCSPASRAPAPRCGSRSAGPGGPARGALGRAGRRATTRSTPTWSPTPRRCSSGRSRRRSSTPPTPTCSAPHLCAAAAELPLTEADLALFGPTDAGAASTALVDAGLLRRRPRGWFWTDADRAADHVSLRGSGGGRCAGRGRTGRVVGTVDGAAAHGTAHAGAVYVHQGETWLVDRARPRRPSRWSRPATRGSPRTPARVTRSTSGRSSSDQAWGEVRAVLRRGRACDPGRVVPAPAAARARCSARSRSTCPSGRCGPRRCGGRCPTTLLAEAGLEPADLPGAAHAAEHCSIGLLPLFATCDRWDIGGVSTALHPDTGPADRLRVRRPPRRRGLRRARLRGRRAWLDRDPRRHRGVRVPRRLPLVRAVAQVRQRERPARQAGSTCLAVDGAGPAAELIV